MADSKAQKGKKLVWDSAAWHRARNEAGSKLDRAVTLAAGELFRTAVGIATEIEQSGDWRNFHAKVDAASEQFKLSARAALEAWRRAEEELRAKTIDG